MAGDVGHGIGPADHPGGVDEVRDPQREVPVPFLFGPQHVVGLTCFALDIGQQREPEALRLGKGLVVRRRVERGADDDAPCGPEIVGPVTQGLAFDGSARGRGLGIPPQKDPLACEVAQRDRVAVLIGKRELRCWRSGCQQCPPPGARRSWRSAPRVTLGTAAAVSGPNRSPRHGRPGHITRGEDHDRSWMQAVADHSWQPFLRSDRALIQCPPGGERWAETAVTPKPPLPSPETTTTKGEVHHA